MLWWARNLVMGEEEERGAGAHASMCNGRVEGRAMTEAGEEGCWSESSTGEGGEISLIDACTKV
jgi:hypothetical protein